MGVRPQRVGDAFGEGMMGFSKMFVFCCKKNFFLKIWRHVATGAAKEKRFFRKLRKHSWEGYYLAGYLLVIAQSAGRQHLRTESPARKNVLILEESFFESAKHTVKKKKSPLQSIERPEYQSIHSNLLRLAFKCLQCQMWIYHLYVFPRNKNSHPSKKKRKHHRTVLAVVPPPPQH